MSNKNTLTKIFENSLIYAVCGLLLKCFNFFLMPLYTTYLTTADYGVTSVANSFLSTMSFITALSLFSAVLRFYVDLKDDTEKLRRFYGTIVVFVFSLSVLICALFFVFHDFLTRYIFKGVDFAPTVILCIVSLVFYCQHGIYENVLKSQQKALKYAVITIGYFFVSIALNVTFVVYFQLGATGVLLANLIAYILYFLVFIVDMIHGRMITFCIDVKLLRDALKYSIPIIPHNLSTQIALLISKVLIGNEDTLSAVGIYAVSSLFGNLADTVQGYASNAYGPWLYEQLSTANESYKKNIRMVSNVLTLIIGLFMIGISLFAHDYIILFLEESYALAWMYVPFIVGVYLIKIMYYFYVEVLFYYKKAARLLFVATLSSSLMNIILSYFAIPVWGIVGSIFADAIAMLLRVAIIIIISRRYDDIGLKLFDFIKNMLLIAVFIIIGLFFSYKYYMYSFSVLDFFYRCLVVLAYMALVFAKYKNNIMTFIKNRRKIC